MYPDAAVYAAAGSFIDEGLAAGREIFADAANRPTAVIAQSDLLAAGVIRAAEEAGLRVPEDVSVTGFDGIVVDGLAPYELTTLVQPATEKGRAAGARGRRDARRRGGGIHQLHVRVPRGQHHAAAPPRPRSTPLRTGRTARRR